MANQVCTSLGLIGKDLTGKLVQVAEEHGCDSSFLLGSLMWNASRTDTAVCLLALHNPKSHYQNVAKRLGHNMDAVVVLEPFTMYVEKTRRFDDLDMGNDGNLKRLFSDIKESMTGMSGKTCLMIDDLCDLLCLGANVSQVIAFLQYCRGLTDSLIVGTHFSDDNDNQRRVSNFVAHLAQCRLAVAPLKTGFSSDVTGTIHVDARPFHYKLTDRQVRVFAPGSAGIQL